MKSRDITITIYNYKKILKQYLNNGLGFKGTERIEFSVNDEIYTYLPQEDYLACTWGLNQTIFNVLGLDKKKFCERVYGRKVGEQDFPEYHGDDETMMVKIALALFEECESHNVPVNEIEMSSLDKNDFLDKIKDNVNELNCDIFPNIERIQPIHINFAEDMVEPRFNIDLP